MNFNVKSFTRLLIHSISRHSNWKPALIKHTLQNTGVYANAGEWKTFIYYALITLGLAFSVAGIIFFFAFNWAHLHKFVKLGIVQTILLTFTLLAVFVKSSTTVKNILLMADISNRCQCFRFLFRLDGIYSIMGFYISLPSIVALINGFN